MGKKKILIVDDEEHIHKIVKKILNAPGLDLFSAMDGVEAIRQAAEVQPDLILLDINMPHMDGNEVMRDLRKNDATRPIPVIMLTGNGEVIDRMVGYELGVQDYITKPFQMDDLRQRIESVIGKQW